MSRRLQNVGLVLASLAIGILGAEIALRAAGVSFAHFYRPDPLIGEVPIPGAEGWDRSENLTYVRFNSMGMRDREHSVGNRLASTGSPFSAIPTPRPSMSRSRRRSGESRSAPSPTARHGTAARSRS